MILRRLLLVLASIPGAALAAPAVTSGEHEGFSRIAIAAPAGQEWRIQNAGHEVRITLLNQRDAFVLDRIFDLIPRSRIAAAASEVSERGATLVLTLGCDCPVEVFATPGNVIVADVYEPLDDGPDGTPDAAPDDPLAEPAPENLFARASLTLPQSDLSGPPVLPAVGDLAEPDPDDPEEAAAAAADLTISGEGVPATDVGLQPPAAGDRGQDRSGHPDDTAMAGNDHRPADASGDGDKGFEIELAEAREALMRQLLLSVDQGLIDYAEPEGPVAEPHDGAGAPEPEVAALDAGTPPHAVPDDTPDLSVHVAESGATSVAGTAQITTVNVYDRDQADRPAELGPDRPDCPDPSLLDPRTWPDPADFLSESAELGGRITGEFDRPDPVAVTRFIQLHLAAGFGAEARLILTEFGGDLPFREALASIARLVDGVAVPDPGLAGLRHCSDAAAFWFVLEGNATGPSVDPAKVAGVFSELPPFMRRLLALRVGQALLDRGADEEAERIFYLVTRSPGPAAPDLSLFEARLALRLGQAQKAAEIYTALIAEDSAWATLAALELAELVLAENWPAPDGLAANLASRSGVFRGSETGRRLVVAEMYLRAGSRKLSDALAILAETRRRNPEYQTDYGHILADLILAAAPAPDDRSAYAASILAHGSELALDGSGREARLLAARNLRLIGLPEAAADLLGPLAAAGDEQAVLEAARAAIDRHEFAAAESWLAGLEGAESAALRERILLSGGQITSDSPVPASDARSAFVLGDWPQALSVEDEYIRALAAFRMARSDLTAGAPVRPSGGLGEGDPADTPPDPVIQTGELPSGTPALADASPGDMSAVFAADISQMADGSLAGAEGLVGSTAALLGAMTAMVDATPALSAP
jgi:hypothetical protein